MDDEQIPRTTVVPWDTVTDAQGRPAYTAGQIRAAVAHLADDAPVVVHVATDEDGVADDQIIVDAGHGRIDWGDGYGMEQDPLFALECDWPATHPLTIRPDRPRRPRETRP